MVIRALAVHNTTADARCLLSHWLVGDLQRWILKGLLNLRQLYCTTGLLLLACSFAFSQLDMATNDMSIYLCSSH
jgi:hypothetical protein